MGNPEQERVAELIRQVREGRATDAEREELALYGEESAECKALIVRAQEQGELGKGWLARYEADRRIVDVENTRLARAERKVGAGLIVGGVAASFVAPPLAFVMLGVGAGLLTWSVVRVAIKNAGKDPYEDVEE